MAKRKNHRRSHTRRRRVSGVGMKGVLVKVAGIGAGIFAGRLVSTKLTSLNPKISGAIVIAAGVLLPKYLKGDFGSGMGDGLISAGVLAELQSFNVISGIGYATPGNSALTNTGANGYRPSTARTVGDAGRPIMRSTVGGALNGIPKSMMNAIGALYEE